MKKILFVTNDFGPRTGGIETFIIGLIERLPKNSVVIYTSQQGDTSKYDADWKNNFGAIVVRDRSKILLPTLRVNRSAARIARENKTEIACFGAATPLGIMAPTLRRAGVRRIVSLTHGHEVWWAKVFPFTLAMRRVGNTVDALSYLGEFTKQAIGRSLSPASKSAMVRISPGIDTDHFAPTLKSLELRKELGLEKKQVIVSVGRLVHRKGQDRLIQALPLIQASQPDTHLLLIGEGPYRAKLEEFVRVNKVESSVTFIGRVQYAQLPTYIGVGDIFAMPSRSRFFGLEVEGLGIVYLEASSCGLPVIAGNSGGAPDAVLEGETGLVVDGTNVGQIVRAAISLLGDRQSAKNMGDCGREWILQFWSWKRWSDEFQKFLRI